MIEYTVGFLLNYNLDKVILIERNDGPFENKINGLGGKVKEDESEDNCMVRELQEETNGQIDTSVLADIFKVSTIVYFPDVVLHCYGMVLDRGWLWKGCTNREGEVKWYSVVDIRDVTDERFAGNGNVPYLVNEVRYTANERRK